LGFGVHLVLTFLVFIAIGVFIYSLSTSLIDDQDEEHKTLS
jgi:hypothetical protein